MDSKYVKDLRDTAKLLKDQGFPISAGICARSAKRMNIMEDLIFDLMGEQKKTHTKLIERLKAFIKDMKGDTHG